MIELKEAFVLQVFLVRLLLRQDHPKASLHLVLGKILLQPLQIEWVHDELRVNIDQEFVTFKLAEPFDPSLMLVSHGRIIREAIDIIIVLIRLAIVLVVLHGHLCIMILDGHVLGFIHCFHFLNLKLDCGI